MPHTICLIYSPSTSRSNIRGEFNLLSPLRPNYMLYNSALRQDENDTIYPKLKKAGHMFSNTIHTLVSAVLKLQRKSDVSTGLVLYRYSTLV